MELVQYQYSGDSYKDKPFVIMPLGDIQWTGDKQDVAVELLKSRIDLGLSLDAWFVGMGDYIDYASPSNRQRLQAAGLYDNANKVHENAAIGLVNELYEKYLKPTKGRWLGLLEGHHYSSLMSGITTDQLLAQKLDTVFLGTSAFIGLHFTFLNSIMGTVNIWGTHGVGGGTKLGAPLAKLESIAADIDADVYLIGHMTKQAIAPFSSIYPQWIKSQGTKTPSQLRHKTKLLVGTGGFGKGYIEQARQGLTPRGGYVERGMMRPAALGNPIIRIWPRVKRSSQSDGPRSRVFAAELSGETGG